ncbi:MAG TPA: MBL fold metallo-hydrolase, partial [Chitinophaga sp.]
MSFKIRLLRHSTLLLEINGKRILVDPMLSKKEALDPVPNAANSDRIPLVDLPVDDHELETLLQNIDAVLVTHTHRDHWDVAAQQLIPKDKL